MCQGHGQLRRYAQVVRRLEILLNEQVVDNIPDTEVSPAIISASSGL